MKNKTANSYRLSGLLLLLPLLATPARAQSKFGAIQAYVKQHTQPIATIDPAAPDNADLAAIGVAIGEARVVMLGEQDHGDGATFQAKTRLVKYLHEQKGFNVLVWESDFFALNHGWDSLPKQPAAMRAFVRGNIYPYWTACQQAEALLYDYLPGTYATARSLHLAGLDNQLYGAYSRRALPGYLRGFLGQQAVPLAATRRFNEFFVPFLDTLSQSYRFSTKPATYLIAHKQAKLRRFELMADTLLAQLAPAARASYAGRVLENLRVLAQESAVYTEDEIDTYNLRDAQMARNLEWLVREKYPTEKIIVWAANLHIAKWQQVGYGSVERVTTFMGAHFTAPPGRAAETYCLGFLSATGSSRRVQAAQPTPLVPPRRGYFETWLPARLPYGFVDFRAFRAQQPGYAVPFYMRGLGYEGGRGYTDQAAWTTIFDGIFFIREMQPCGKSSFAAPAAAGN
jgi:erythromycin esterase-like protein